MGTIGYQWVPHFIVKSRIDLRQSASLPHDATANGVDREVDREK